MNEFELIKHYFDHQSSSHDISVTVGIGDDAAVLSVPRGKELVVTVDTLVEGRHFPQSLAPDLIAYRALAVNLSDMAAMGAVPRWITLSLSLPRVDEAWLEGFSRGLRALASEHHVSLIGGDTVKGPLCITVQLLGLVTTGEAILRSTAKPGDDVYVTGTLGSAAAAIQHLLPSGETGHSCFLRFARPSPRVEQGRGLVGLASSAIDVSDGLLADLGHIAEASAIGIRLNLDQLPLSRDLVELVGKDQAIAFASSGGDDYELCFTIPPSRTAELVRRAQAWPVPVTCIGRAEKGEIVKCYLDGNRVFPAHSGFDHFAEDI